jgi:hypothetical protein
LKSIGDTGEQVRDTLPLAGLTGDGMCPPVVHVLLRYDVSFDEDVNIGKQLEWRRG